MSSQAPSTQVSLRLQRLIEANQALAQIESLEALLPQLLTFAQEVTLAQASSLLLYKPEKKTLEFALALNDDAQAQRSIQQGHFELRLGEGIAGFVAQEQRSVIVNDVAHDARFFRKVDTASGFTTKCILCSPITYQGQLLGVVQVLNPKSKDVFDQDDLLILESFAHLAAVAIVRSRMLEALLQQERIQAQLDAAARIQQSFLPKIPSFAPDHILFAKTVPAIFVGGDFFDLLGLADGSLLLCVADVSGKGLPAALIGATLWTSLRSLAPYHQQPAELLQALNREVYDVFAAQHFATMVLCRYDPATAQAQLALAGHLPPLFIDQGRVEQVQGISGCPLGIDLGSSYSELSVRLEPNQALLLVSDGVTEARNAVGDFFGDDGIVRSLRGYGQGPWGGQLFDHVQSWRGPSEINDDLTIVELFRGLPVVSRET